MARKQIIRQQGYLRRKFTSVPGAMGALVFDAKICGALAGLQAAVRLPHNSCYICIDNTSAIHSVRSRPLDSSQAEALTFQQGAQDNRQMVLRSHGKLGNEILQMHKPS